MSKLSSFTAHRIAGGVSRVRLPISIAFEPAGPLRPHIPIAFLAHPTAHGSIGPSCAVAQFYDGKLTIWSHTQGVFPDRKAIAELVHMPEDRVHVIHMEGSGCYGQNGADDAAAGAALLAIAVSPAPVRLHWMREQEHSWEPFGPAMLVELEGSVGPSEKVSAWKHEVWSNAHTTRPETAGSLLAGQSVASSYAPPAPKLIPQSEGGGDRNAIPLYAFPNAQVIHHFFPTCR